MILYFYFLLAPVKVSHSILETLIWGLRQAVIHETATLHSVVNHQLAVVGRWLLFEG